MLEQLSLSKQICHRFYVISNAITRAYGPFLSALDLTYPQYLVMLALWEQDKLIVGQLKSLTKIDGGALTLILKKLQDKQLISLRPSEEDKRAKQVSLTEAGKKLELQAADIPMKMRCQLTDISDQEIGQMFTLMDKLISQIDES